MAERSHQTVLSAKLPLVLVEALGREAARQGVSRNALVRVALEHAVTGDLSVFDAERRLARATARMDEEQALVRALEAQSVLRSGFFK